MAPRIPAERAHLPRTLGVSRRRARARHIRERDKGKGEGLVSGLDCSALGERVDHANPPESRSQSLCDTWCNCQSSNSTPPPLLEQDSQAKVDSRPDMDESARSGAWVCRLLRGALRAHASRRGDTTPCTSAQTLPFPGWWSGVFGAHGRDATLYGAERHPMPSRSPRERRLSAPHSRKTPPCLLTVNMFFTHPPNHHEHDFPAPDSRR